ncbi:MAG: TonB-dependent receptor [Thermoanaerobaculia bacterium]
MDRCDRRRGCARALGAALSTALSLLLFVPLGAHGEGTPPASAEGTPPASDEGSELEALLRQETDLATKTRMNHDYVPGMVTVLQGDELEALGTRNVWEALALVPGVQTVKDLYSSPLVLVRGINFIFNSGNIKITVDSVGLNQESAGISSSILLMPIEDVQRLEFMRGPGSAIHGDFAFLGLLNIVTRRDERRAFASADGDRFTAGAHATWSSAGSAHRLSVGISGLWDRDVDGRGPTRTEDRKGFGRFSYAHEGFSLAVQALEATHRIPETDERATEHRLAVEARYARDLSSTMHVEASAGLLRNDDAVGAKQYDGRSFQAGIDVGWRAPAGHDLLLTVGYSRSDVDRFQLFLPPLFDFTLRDLERQGLSAALQDQWAVTRDLTFTAGLRVDRFDDIGSRVTPRFALVYRLGEHQILKTQYAEGFRTPAFFELYGSSGGRRDLEAESIATTELSYIVRQSDFVGRLTLFHSDLRRMIQPPAAPGGEFSNGASARANGVELEWTQELHRALKLSANLSWVDPQDRRATRDVLAASEWLGNLSLLAEPLPWLRVAGRWNHVGTRGGFDGLPAINGYDTVDLTFGLPNVAPDLMIRGGVKNVLDDVVTYITTLPPPLAPILQQYGGRSVWVECAYRF